MITFKEVELKTAAVFKRARATDLSTHFLMLISFDICHTCESSA